MDPEESRAEAHRQVPTVSRSCMAILRGKRLLPRVNLVGEAGD